MAVDYYHHIVVSGVRTAVADFVDRIAVSGTRRVAGVTWKETVPFALESLHIIANITGRFPGESFDMTRWPVVRRGNGRAEVRYRFHTRSIEMHPLLKRLSRVTPNLKFTLVTLCLDDSDWGAFTIQSGKMRGNWLGDK